MRIAPEGWPVIALVGIPALIGPSILCIFWPWIGGPLLGIGLLMMLWAIWFFRDPIRTPPMDRHAVISPADGRVVKIEQASLPPELRHAWPKVGEQRLQRVAIFLNLFNVHVNRTPIGGRITAVAYVPGKFFNASLDKASTHNERALALVEDAEGRKVGFVQIAGLVARRIVCHLKRDQQVFAGERFGLIRFGSRAEIYFPPGSAISVKIGDFVVAGESVLGTLPVMSGSTIVDQRVTPALAQANL